MKQSPNAVASETVNGYDALTACQGAFPRTPGTRPSPRASSSACRAG
jgi:hypothetical protein